MTSVKTQDKWNKHPGIDNYRAKVYHFLHVYIKKQCNGDINLWDHVINVLRQQLMSSVNRFNGSKSCNRSRTSERYYELVYCVYYVSIDNISMWIYMKCSILYKRDTLRLIICACYSLGKALNVGLDVSFDNTQDWKGIWEISGDINSTKTYITNDETSRRIFNGCYIRIYVVVPQFPHISSWCGT
jgi:hypothetical protein